jgi:hypothetical protein
MTQRGLTNACNGAARASFAWFHQYSARGPLTRRVRRLYVIPPRQFEYPH